MARSEAARAEILSGKLDPAAEAIAAAQAGDFGLIENHDISTQIRGVICHTPNGGAPAVRFSLAVSHAIGREEAALIAYTQTYNRTLVSQPAYGDADLCRVSSPADTFRSYDVTWVTRPARPVTSPPRNLHEAARRGDAEQVRRFLATTPVDRLDRLGMSPLAWAVARGNDSAISTLLDAGADPLTGSQSVSALRWAAALGRQAKFTQLLRWISPEMEARHWGKDRVWPAEYLEAAVGSGNVAIVRAIRTRPHYPVRELWPPLPNAEVLELALQDNSLRLANRLLDASLGRPAVRPDLVKLALKHGVDPNAVRNYESPLTTASNGIYPGTPEAVRLLLEAGADPNLMAHRDRPVWIAVRAMTLDRDRDEHDERALAIFQQLVKAGADLNLPDWQGRPGAWQLLFPLAYAPTKLAPSYDTPRLLELVVQNGADLNAEWNGKRMLALVEAQAGRESELAVTLRRLGAR
ncbi:MAG: hypothetical protein C0481_01585 [Phenylobacterium sp.]|nr:hypothetical protein [Phenylobacterium sp.]